MLARLLSLLLLAALLTSQLVSATNSAAPLGPATTRTQVVGAPQSRTGEFADALTNAEQLLAAANTEWATRDPVAYRASLARLFDDLSTRIRETLTDYAGPADRANSLDVKLVPGRTDLGAVNYREWFAAVHRAYAMRMRLLAALGDDDRAARTGTGARGMAQARIELDYLRNELTYLRIALPGDAWRVGERWSASPVPMVRQGVFVLLALGVFLGWRRWAGSALPRLNELAAGAWAYRPGSRGFRETLRYVEALRAPIEWLLLLFALSAIVRLPELREPLMTLRIAATWFFVAWLGLRLAGAIAERRADSPTRRSMRASLRILIVFAALLGACLQLAQTYLGRGAVHALVWDAFQVLSVPVAIALLLVWRPAIRARLEREARFSPAVERMLAHRGPLGIVLGTLGGFGYVVMDTVRRMLLVGVRRSGLGRSLVAEALRQSMVKADRTHEGAPPLDADVRKSWLRGEDVVESAIDDELREVRGMLDRGWKTVVVVGERGGGKTTFLRQLASVLDEEMLIVSCPHGGAKETIAAIGRALGRDGDASTVDEVFDGLHARGVKLLALDDVQRLTRPVLGGQAELDALIESMSGWPDVRVVVAIDAAAWEYLSPLREGRSIGASAVRLSAWTEGQIGELLESRARSVGMELDYGDLRFPRYLLEQDFDSPEEGLRWSYRRILWGEAEGNPEVALRLVVERLIEKEDGDGLLRLPRSPEYSELDGLSLVELLVLRFLLQTDGATVSELVAGLRYPPATIESVIDAAALRGFVEENHGRFRVSWTWFRLVSRVLKRKNMLGAAPQRAERTEAQGARRPDARRGASPGPRRSSWGGDAVAQGGRRP